MIAPLLQSEAHAQANAEQVRVLREALAQRRAGGLKIRDRTPLFPGRATDLTPALEATIADSQVREPP